MSLGLFISACGSNQKTTNTAQAVAQTSVKLVNDAWKEAAKACLSPGVDSTKCGPPLWKAYNYIVVASSASDTWDTVGQGQYMCSLAMAASGIEATFAALGVPMPTLVADAVDAVKAAGTASCAQAGVAQ